MTTVVDPLELRACVLKAVARARMVTPIVTGNLRYKSLRVDRVDDFEFTVKFDVNIAPYAEKVNNSSRKSAGWFERFQKQLKTELEAELRKVGYIIG